ncbi:conserved hypothetical protein [Treponema primitia ZAS-2]|uniref:Putative zinc-finger domain-containing protein n=1 Tax=Treponema primitia (strain ATCC BAA-887 / DSM 12427 / ZAS-2) TaxID=545694 RepID=F5YNR8_TREPZ|nr:zf-HC2 domain-containing protein [Treponema primitia]AEF84648.1 conserved hypothetical protein [Treponema primitia ZAS-2]
MCPDPQMLSLYFDGELPSPWKEKMEAHLGECPVCEKSLTRYRDMSKVLRDGPLQSEETETGASLAEVSHIKERVWLRLNTPGLTERIPLHTWNRSVSVPLPLIITAAAALIMAFGFFFVSSAPRGTPPDQAVAAVDMTTIVPISDLSGVLKLLGDESPDIVIIRLPESRSFMSSGQPAIIRAADYSGSKRPR